MLRKARIDAPGALHHIMVRGIEGKKIFRDNNDREDFLTGLGKILPETSPPVTPGLDTQPPPTCCFVPVQHCYLMS